MILIGAVGEDSWESLGLQGDPTILKEISPGISLEGMMLKLKLQYFDHLMQRVDSLGKTDAGRDWEQEEKGMTEDEMAGWHHGLDGCESVWTPGGGDGQGDLACAIHGVAKSRTRLSDCTELNWTELIRRGQEEQTHYHSLSQIHHIGHLSMPKQNWIRSEANANIHKEVSSCENISTDQTKRLGSGKNKKVNCKVKLNCDILASTPIFFSKSKSCRQGYEIDIFKFCIFIM